ncbi:MAG TPA: hypothetical protein VK034_28245, partial [Enhygromyxa sp.]|nr:hypothetical protein [Enhygromyxa sp.]
MSELDQVFDEVDEVDEIDEIESDEVIESSDVAVPEPIDEGAVTRALTVEDVTTHEYPAAPETVEIEPSAALELTDEAIEQLTPAIDPAEPEERTTLEFDREPPTLATPRPEARRSPTTVVGMIRPNGAVILLGLLCALAIVESIAAFLAYRERIADE